MGNRTTLRKKIENARYFALHWPLELPSEEIHKICSERILLRGENHQKLRADNDEYKRILWTFIRSTEEPAFDEFDVIETMDLTENIEDSITRAVKACVRVLGLPFPSNEKMERAFTAAREYRVVISDEEKERQAKLKAAKKKPRYYALRPNSFDLEGFVRSTLDSAKLAEGEPTRSFFGKLCKDKRIERKPHVTIVHERMLPESQPLWDACEVLAKEGPPEQFEVTFRSIVHNDRAMAISVDLAETSGTDATSKFFAELGDSPRKRLHITVGRREEGINAYEAAELIQKWRDGKVDDVCVVPVVGEETVKVNMKGVR